LTDELINRAFDGGTPSQFAQDHLRVVAGDFNGNRVVDAADYVLWRKGLGTTFTASDYNVWRSHFAQTAGSGAHASATVPEPATLVMLVFASVGWYLRRGRAA
jgi:hypothetical protein